MEYHHGVQDPPVGPDGVRDTCKLPAKRPIKHNTRNNHRPTSAKTPRSTVGQINNPRTDIPSVQCLKIKIFTNLFFSFLSVQVIGFRCFWVGLFGV